MSGEGEDLTPTTPVHDSKIKMDFCRILVSKERYTHRPVGYQVVGSEAEGRKSEAVIDFGNPGCRVANAISWMLTTTFLSCSRHSPRPFTQIFYATRRNYAPSRSPQRSPGVGRRRQHVENDNYRGATSRSRPAREQVPHEDQPSSETSSLWQESARSISSDPAEGLRRLLMTHESLVVTRFAFPGLLFGRMPTDAYIPFPSQIEMLSIFVGFEQTNKYAISELSTLRSIAQEADSRLQPRRMGTHWDTLRRSQEGSSQHYPVKSSVPIDRSAPLSWITRVLRFSGSVASVPGH